VTLCSQKTRPACTGKVSARGGAGLAGGSVADGDPGSGAAAGGAVNGVEFISGVGCWAAAEAALNNNNTKAQRHAIFRLRTRRAAI
jgi:hypothetical protein